MKTLICVDNLVINPHIAAKWGEMHCLLILIAWLIFSLRSLSKDSWGLLGWCGRIPGMVWNEVCPWGELRGASLGRPLPQAAATPVRQQFGSNVDFTLGFNLLLVYGKFPNGIIKVVQLEQHIYFPWLFLVWASFWKKADRLFLWTLHGVCVPYWLS